MLLKGGRNFKIDPQHLSPRMCARQRNYAHNASDARGCLVLNHDKVVPPRGERLALTSSSPRRCVSRK